jgi:hypothetical protein
MCAYCCSVSNPPRAAAVSRRLWLSCCFGAILTLQLLLFTAAVSASDVYLFRFHARGTTVGFAYLRWQDTVLLLNHTDVPLVVRAVEVSKGFVPISSPPDRITIAPGSVVSLDDTYLAVWEPVPLAASGDNLWVLHIDVPDGITVESRDEIIRGSASPFAELEPPFALGAAPMPTFTSIVPAAEKQSHLGTDLGYKKARINVTIYNAGSVDSKAHIEVRRTCDSLVVDFRDMTVAASTVVQTSGLDPMIDKSFDQTCATKVPWARYTVVTVDQPSLSLVSVVSEDLSSSVPGLTPVIGLIVR